MSKQKCNYPLQMEMHRNINEKMVLEIKETLNDGACLLRPWRVCLENKNKVDNKQIISRKEL